jgi:hypothetical protein
VVFALMAQPWIVSRELATPGTTAGVPS